MVIRLLRMRLLAVGFALASIIVSTATMAQRASCTASFNATTGALVVEAVAVAATTYLAKLSQASGDAMVFNLDSATVTNNSTKFQSASDGLTFNNATALTYSNRSVDSRKTLMPDGKTWRLYQ
jgi:hypothetical protein